MIDCSHFFRTALFTLFGAKFFQNENGVEEGPINVKKPQTKWQFQNANCTFCLFLFFYYCALALAVVFTIVCDMQLFIGIVTSAGTMMMQKKMDTFANLMFAENIKQLTASI